MTPQIKKSSNAHSTEADSLVLEVDLTNPNKRRDLRKSPKNSMNSDSMESQGSDRSSLTNGDKEQETSVREGASTPTQNNSRATKISMHNDVREEQKDNTVSFKVVNNRSANRRECKRIMNAHISQDHSSMTDKHNNRVYTRATPKLTLLADDNPIAMMVKVIKEFIKELHESDEDITLIPWRKVD